MKARSILTNTAVLLVARVASVLLSVVSLAFASRYLGARSYGVLFSALALSGLLMSVADLGVASIAPRELARPMQPAERRQLAATLSALLWMSMTAFAVLGAAIAWVALPGPANQTFRLATIGFLAAGLLGPATWIGTAGSATSGRSYIAGLAQLASGALGVAAMIVAVLLKAGFAGILVAQLVATAALPVAFLLSAPEARLRPRLAVPWRPLLRESLPMGAIAAINVVYIKADAVLLTLLSSKAQVGIYGLSYNVTNGLITLPSILMLAAQPSLVRALDDRQRFDAILAQCFFLVQVIGLAVIAEAICFRQSIASLLGGASFHSAGTVIAILTVGVVITFPTGVLGSAILALGRQRVLAWGVSANLLVNVGANLILIPLAGAHGSAWAFGGTELLALIGYAVLFRRDIHMRPRRLLANAGALAALLAPCILGSRFLSLGHTADLFVWGIVGLALYVAVLWRCGALREIHQGLTGVAQTGPTITLPVGA